MGGVDDDFARRTCWSSAPSEHGECSCIQIVAIRYVSSKYRRYLATIQNDQGDTLLIKGSAVRQHTSIFRALTNTEAGLDRTGACGNARPSRDGDPSLKRSSSDSSALKRQQRIRPISPTTGPTPAWPASARRPGEPTRLRRPSGRSGSSPRPRGRGPTPRRGAGRGLFAVLSVILIFVRVVPPSVGDVSPQRSLCSRSSSNERSTRKAEPRSVRRRSRLAERSSISSRTWLPSMDTIFAW